MKYLRPSRFAVVSLSVILLSLFTVFNKSDTASLKSGDPVSALVPNITINKAGTLDTSAGGDLNNNGVINPGDRINYTITVSNTGAGATDAANVIVQDILNSNLTLLPGSVKAAPIAKDDSYQTIGNTQLQVSASQTIAAPGIFVSGNVLSNDVDPNGGTLSASLGTKTAGAVVTLNSDGTFTYTPPPGFVGTDTFTYNLIDNPNDGFSVTGTVSITVTDFVWYVKNNAPAGGNGTSIAPFSTLTAAQNALPVGGLIYVYQGDGTTNNQNAGITLDANQRLIGAGVALTVPVSVNNGPNPTLLLPAGAQPQIGNSAGAGITVGNNGGVEIQGLNIAGTGDAINANYSGGTAGTLLIANNTIRSAGNEGIDIDSASTGAINLSINNNAIAATGTAVDVARTAGTLRITGFGNNSISGNSAGTGISMNGVIFDADAFAAGFQTVSGGNLFIGQSGNGVNAAGMLLTAVTGDISFTDLDIFADGGAALQIQSTGTFNAGTGTGFRIQTTANAATLSATNGAAADIASATIDLQLSSLTSTGSTTRGLNLDSVAGTFSAGNTSSISNIGAAATAYRINNSSLNATYNGTINITQGTGVSLTTNSGTYNFTGLLTLSTGANQAFMATGGGTVNATASNNTLTTTTGIAVNITTPTNIGSSGVTFKSINVNNGASNSAVNAIILNGTTGNFTVTGDGSQTSGFLNRNGSGGTLNRTTGHSVNLTNAQNVTLRQMNITNTQGSGAGCPGACASNMVNSSGGSNITLSAVHLQTPSGHGWYGVNLGGTNAFNQNGRVENWQTINSRGIYIENTNTNFNSFTINRSLFTTSATGADGFLFDGEGATSGIVTVTDSEFTLLDDDGVQINNDGSGNITAVVKRNNFHDADATASGVIVDGNNTLFLANAGSGTLNFTVGADANADLSSNPTLDRNTFKNLSRVQVLTGMVAVNAGTTNKTGTRLNGTIRNNVITNDINFDSRRDGISFGIEANGGSHGSHKILVADNTISNVGLMGMRVLLNSTNDVAGGSLPDTNLTIRNNTISNVGISPLVTGDSQTGIEIEPNFSNFSNGGDMGTNLLLQANTITNSSASGVGDTVEIIARGGNTGTYHTMNLTMLGNNLTNTGGTSVVDVYTSTDPALTGTGITLNLDMNSDNIPANANNTTNSAGGAGSIQLRNNVSGALYRIENLSGNPANTFVSQRNNNDTVSVTGTIGSTGAVTLPQLPDSYSIAFNEMESVPDTLAQKVDEISIDSWIANSIFNPSNNVASSYQSPLEKLALNESFAKHFDKSETISNELIALAKAEVVFDKNTAKTTNSTLKTNYLQSVAALFSEVSANLSSAISPTVSAQKSSDEQTQNQSKNKTDAVIATAPFAGETVCVDGDSTTLPPCAGGFNLAAGESTTITFTVTVASNFTGTSIPNTANVTAAGGFNLDSNTLNTTVVQPPSITKDFVAQFISIGGTTALNFTITNPNPSTQLTGVAVTDVLPAGLSVANSTANVCGGTNNLVVTAATRTIQLTNATIAGGANCQFSVTVTGATEGVQNNVTQNVTSTNGGQGNTATDSVTVINPPTLTKAFTPNQIQLNSTSSLQFTLSNPNTGLALNTLAFTDTLPAGVTAPNTAATTVCTDGSYSIAANVLSFTKPTLAAGANCQFSVTITGTTAGLKTNTTSTVTAANSNAGSAATANLTVIAAPTIAKAFSPTTIASGGSSTVTLTLANSNTTGALTGASFTDLLSNMTAVGGAAGGTCVGASSNNLPAGAVNLSFTGITIPNNGNCTVTFQVTSNVPGVNPNTTSGVTTTQTAIAGTVSNTANLTVLAPPVVGKSFSPSSVAVNGISTLSITITNPAVNTVSLTGVGVVDNFPAGLVVDATPASTNSCLGSTFTPVAAAASITISGVTIPASGTCTFTVKVKGTTAGAKVNTTNAVTSSNAGTGNTATATLGVGTIEISGTVKYGILQQNQAQKFVSGVLMSATGASSVSVNSDSVGAYLLTNLNSGGNYTVTPSKTGQVNGITAFDATLVLRCVAAGPNCVLTVDQQEAADSDGDNTVSAFDATQILRFVAANGQNANTGQVGNWKFDPVNTPYTNLTANQTAQDYKAYLAGDIDGDWAP